MSDNLVSTLLSRLKFPIFFLGLMWVIHLAQFVTGQSWLVNGILPRDIDGLKGILMAPLLHSGFGHIISNSAPLFFGMVVIWLFYKSVSKRSFILIYILTGIAVWAFALNNNSIHVGASGVVYGLISFIFFNGIFRRNIKSIALALIIFFMFGTMIYGVLPVNPGVSWESHLYGGIVGILVSFLFKNQIEGDEKRKIPTWEKVPEEEKLLLNRDTFEKSRAEKQEELFDRWNSDHT